MIEVMKKTDKKYLDLMYSFLKNWLTPAYEELLERYTEYPQEYSLEEIDGYTYFLFCYPVLPEVEQMVLLVFEEDRIIADLACIHTTMDILLTRKDLYQYMSEDSDWSYLQHYILCNYFYPEIPYPCLVSSVNISCQDVLCFSNIYVSRRFRRQHIFSNMLSMTYERAVRYRTGNTQCISCISLDPDVACYGEDSSDVPYIYSMKDETDRMRNKSILEGKGYTVFKLEETEPQENNDGTKLWFAVLQQLILIEQTDSM